MARHRSDSRAGPSAGISDGLADAARDRLGKAVSELRRLTQDQLFQAMGRLTEAEDTHGASSLNGDSAPRRPEWSAEHVRTAAELEAAIRCCRLIEQELGQQLDVLAAGSDGQPGTLARHGHRKPREKNHRVGMAGWLKVVSPRTRPGHDQRGEEAVTASPAEGKSAPRASPAASPAASRSDADIAARTLGPLELDVAGKHVVRWSSLKARGLFQYLLVHRGRPVRRDVLMGLQWPDHTPASARNNLNVALHSLRNTLDGPWQGLQPVLYRDGCYLLNPALTWWIDREEFLYAHHQAQLFHVSSHLREATSHYQAAVGLYRGLLFEDDPVGDWYVPEQRHLNDLYLEALESLGEIYFDLGELTSAERFGQQALTSDPCCESAHRLLMRCYALEHKQQLVSRQYRLCVDALRDELGVAPGTETLRLFHSLTSASHLALGGCRQLRNQPEPDPRTLAPGLPVVAGCDGAERGWDVWRHEVQQVIPLFGGEVAPGVNLEPVGVERRAADLI
jgi:DNA-binding SARP family transcriptional activator